tara:strand:- start:85 stop:360 length:276 start_codon:yes stop_codon:yes gene_type:complete
MKKKEEITNIKSLDFEEAMKKLNEIIQALENDEVKLSDAVERFELGSELAKHCKKLLDDAEIRINAIEINKSGEVVRKVKIDSDNDESENN